MAYQRKDPYPEFLKTKELGEKIRTDDGSAKCYLLVGEEDYLLETAVSSIKKKWLGEGAETMDYVKLDFGGKALETSRIRDNLELPPWMSPKRIVYAVNFEFNADNSAEMEKLVGEIPDTSLLLLRCVKFDKRKKALLNAFKKNAVMAYVDFLDQISACGWVTKQLGKNEIRIDEESAVSIYNRCEKSMRKMSTEINKILLYCKGKGVSNVNYDLVEMICPPDLTGSVFNMTDAIGAKNAGKALLILDNLIASKENILQIQAMFARQIKQMICVKDLNGDSRLIMERLRLQDFQVKKLIKQAQGFDRNSLITLYSKIAQADFDIKTGNARDRETLESLIVLACVK